MVADSFTLYENSSPMEWQYENRFQAYADGK